MDTDAARASISSLGLGPFLDRLESSAKRRGDLRSANRARYARLTLDNQLRKACLDAANRRIGCIDEHRDTPAGDLRRAYLWDRYVYRDIAGYLVRPLVPLKVFFGMLLVSTLVRGLARIGPSLASRSKSGPGRGNALGRMSRTVRLGISQPSKAIVPFITGAHEAFASAFRKKAEISVEESDNIRQNVLATLKWGEFLAYKILLALFVLSLGNSNATIRQLLDAVRT